MRSIIEKIAYKFGSQLLKYFPRTSGITITQRLFSYHKINLVMDVGANTGQYANFLRNMGYAGKIVSFEPLSTAYDKLVAASRNDPLWEVAPRAAIGNRDGKIKINISKNSESSSILKILDSHVKSAPDSIYIDSEVVRLSKLDTIARDYFNNSEDSIYLKIDVQGAEMQVLEGASQLLQRIIGIQIELSLTPLYEGETLFREMLEKMIKLGYELHAFIPGFTDMNTGRLLQLDGIFFRKPSF